MEVPHGFEIMTVENSPPFGRMFIRGLKRPETRVTCSNPRDDFFVVFDGGGHGRRIAAFQHEVSYHRPNGGYVTTRVFIPIDAAKWLLQDEYQVAFTTRGGAVGPCDVEVVANGDNVTLPDSPHGEGFDVELR